MKKLTRCRETRNLLLGCLPVLCIACACTTDDRYDATKLKDADMSITLFQKGIEFPIGTTDKITFADIIGLDTSDPDAVIKEAADGSLSFSISGEQDMSSELETVNLNDLSGLPGFQYSNSFTCTPTVTTGMAIAPSASGTITIPVNDSQAITVLKASDLPEGLTEITEATFKDCWINTSIQFSGLPTAGTNGYAINVTVKLPDFLTPSTITLSGKLDSNGAYTATPVQVTRIAGIKGGSDVTGKIQIDGTISTTVTSVDASVASRTVNATATASIGNSAGKIVLDDVKGKYSNNFSVIRKLDMDSLPDLLKEDGTCLDLKGATLSMKFTGNIGVAISGDMTLTPYHNGVKGNVLTVKNIALPFSASPTVDETTSCTISEGLEDLIKSIPDYIEIGVSGKSDATKEFHIQTGASYKLGVTYELCQPLVVGSAFKLSYSEEVDLGDISDIIKETTIGLKLDVENSIPLKLKMDVNFLDENGKVLAITANPVTMDIAAGAGLLNNASNAAVKTNGEVVIKTVDGADVDAIDKLEVKFTMDSAADGAAISAKDYIQAGISASLPEGYTIKSKKE